MRILVTMGTRPEIIKLAPVCHALARYPEVTTDVFWTGQHTDLASGLLEWFDLRPAYSADDIVGVKGIVGKHARIAQHTDLVLCRKHYDWIIVQGDTTSAVAAATAGFLNRVPVAHVEAGLRTGDLLSPWPEEYNRRVITQSANLHFAPTAGAARNLLEEGVPPEQIREVGNTVIDSLLYTKRRVDGGYQPRDPVIQALPRGKKIVLATLHRRENIGPPLQSILHALRILASDGDKLIVLPVHANPEIRAEVLVALGDVPNARIVAPLQYPDLVYLMNQAWVVVTDSGGIQEEAPTFGLRVLITRESTERPEVVEAGFGSLVGSNEAAIIQGVRALTARPERPLVAARNPFGAGHASEQIAVSLCSHPITEIAPRRQYARQA